MNRKDFLNRLGIGAAFVLTTSCMNACSKAADIGPVDFTLDLDDPSYSKLKTNGNYIVVNDTVVARTVDGDYVAATVICSHEQKKRVTYQKSSNEFLCTEHSARFDLSGKGLNNDGRKGLTIFQTTLNGNLLKVVG
ncbi:MAG: Rieske 2Fe-2S domain-containing protein [Chitinophagales bacterium]